MKKTFLFASLFLVMALASRTQSTMVITAGTTFKTTGGVVITLQDMNLVTDGSVQQLPGEGVFRFTGAANNTISGATIPLLNQVEVAKSGGARVTLQQTVRVGTSVNFVSGLLDLGNAQLQLEPTAQLLNETEANRMTTAGTGTARIIVNLNAPAAVNPGNLGLQLTSSQNLGSVTILRGHSAITLPTVSRPSINRYYEVIPTNNTNLNATLRFRYWDAELNGRTESQLSLWRSSDNSNWTGTGFTSRDASTNFIEITTLASLTRWWRATDINFPTSLFDRLPEDKQFRLWPNPASPAQPVYLQLSAVKRTAGTLQLLDGSGRLVYQQPVLLEKGINTLSFRVAGLANGLYTVVVTGEDGSRITSSLVQQ
ncbi:MAG TPA: hypothetical protein PKE63_00645 [Lacibacter sp.]|nr:hypothetical protein [Lacibacter sp.]HMO90063.1 hypothetical protein [Lacibacter sp.]HMP85750.1 hypothetical protein [Lacibacter sp.]